MVISLTGGWTCNLLVPLYHPVPPPCGDSREPGHGIFLHSALASMLFLSESACQAPLALPIPKVAGCVARGSIMEQIPCISAAPHPGIFLSAEPSLRMWTHSLNKSPPAIIPQIHLARNVMPCLMGQLSATQGGG